MQTGGSLSSQSGEESRFKKAPIRGFFCMGPRRTVSHYRQRVQGAREVAGCRGWRKGRTSLSEAIIISAAIVRCSAAQSHVGDHHEVCR